MKKLIPLDKSALPALKSEDDLTEIEKYSGLGYPPEQIALLLGINEQEFIEKAKDPKSTINYEIRRGILLAEAYEMKALLGDAHSGNTFASARLAEIKRTKAFESTKLDIFGGFDDIKSFDKISDYLTSGSSTELEPEEQLYMQMLLMMYNLDRRDGRRKTIAYFVNHHSLTHAKASQMHDEAMNLFYCDRNIEKKAIRNKEAETLFELAEVAKRMAKNAKDLEAAANIRAKAHALMELNKPDPNILPKEAYLRPFRVFTLDVTTIGLPSVSRNELAAQIDGLPISEVEKKGLRRDAMIEDIDFVELIEDVQAEAED